MRKMFSEKQIEKIAQEPLTSGEVDIVGKTLYQINPSYELDLTDLISANKEGIEVHSSFSKIQLIGNLLMITLNGYLENTTEEAINSVGFSQISLTLPSDIASKLYDVDGKSAHENGSSIISGDGFILDYATYGYFRLINDNGVNAVRILVAPSVNIPAGARRDFAGRIFLSIF